MAVKDLVGLYDSQGGPSASPVAGRKTSRPQARVQVAFATSAGKSTRSSSPPPSPARFIRHSHVLRDAPSSGNQAAALSSIATRISSERTSATLRGPPGEDESNITKDVADELDYGRKDIGPGRRSPQPESRMKKWLASNARGMNSHDETQSLLHEKSSPPRDSGLPSNDYEFHPLYPIDSRSGESISTSVASSSTVVQKPLSSSASTLVQTRSTPASPHTPVPASTVFARNAAPLYLPKLDEYLASLPKPSFTPISSKAKGKQREVVPMFPPMDLLAASGKTLEDLETNSQIAAPWRNRKSIFGGLTNIVLGLTGSSALASFYSLQGLMNTVQIFALILGTIVPHTGVSVAASWRDLFLGTIPNILALNFASTLIESLIFLIVFMTIAGLLLFIFQRSTANCDTLRILEGLQRPTSKASGWGIVIVCFLLTVIYLPLSSMAIHVLVWSDDLWAVPNPYTNSTSNPPEVAPLGPSDQYRDPLNFCWTTTMKRNEVNFAPVVVILSAVVVAVLTFWFPIHLRHVIKRAVPRTDPYTELGRPRSRSDMDREYQRLLDRDTGPFAFLYKGFRRDWETYEAVYLFAKLSTLFIVAVVNPDNCLFRSLSHTRVAIVRQILLVVAAFGFFLAQCFLAPFLDPINNASEWTSRLNYVLTAGVALAVIFDTPATDILNGPVLYTIYIVTYGLSFYFTIIDTSIMHRTVKRLTRRIDFSIDIFSPRIDLSPSSVHTKRRIWQEAVSTLLLTSAECGIPKKQRMKFAQALGLEYPPYLLDFCGSPGERHVENLKILREVGNLAYNKGLALTSGPDHEWFKYLEMEIQDHYVGPDCYWKSRQESNNPDCTKFFGNAWWIPFPPTLVIRYDDGPLAVLQTVPDLEAYVNQNSSVDIQRRREIRMTLRSLDGQRIIWPYNNVQLVGAHTPWCCCKGRRYKARKVVHYQTCVLRIKRRGHLVWEGFQFGSGFDIQLVYDKNVKLDGGAIGVNDDYDLTQPLARFLALNQELIPSRLAHLEGVLDRYRDHHKRECHTKAHALTYRFLSYVYDRPRDPTGIAESSIEFERDLRVRQLMVGSEAIFQATYERLEAVSTSEIATWWYIFWDDLWRRNYDTISALNLHASDFNPHYPTSIAYTPLPRPVLETFLIQRGLLHRPLKTGDVFDAGILNKVYLRMNDIVFRGSSRAIWFHLGEGETELDMEEVDLQTLLGPSTLGTGGGTDHDDASIRARPTYRWEGILDDPLRKGKGRRPWLAKMSAWFGLTPLWRSGIPSRGLSLDVQLENGRYVLMDNQEPLTTTSDKAFTKIS